MTTATRAEMQRLLAAEFERRGWEYDLSTVPSLLDEVERTGTVEGQHLADKVPADRLRRIGATRADLAVAITDAIGGRTLATEQAPVTIAINDHRHSVNLGPSASIGGNVNTGSQISIQGDSPNDDLLDALATLVTAGLGGEWNVEAADDLAQVINRRADITHEAIQQRVLEAAHETGAGREKAKWLLTQIAQSSISGAVGVGVTTALALIK